MKYFWTILFAAIGLFLGFTRNENFGLIYYMDIAFAVPFIVFFGFIGWVIDKIRNRHV